LQRKRAKPGISVSYQCAGWSNSYNCGLNNDYFAAMDYVSGDFEIRFGQPDYTGRFCVIGSKINIEEIEKLFNFRG